VRQIEIEWVPLGITVTASLAPDKNRALADLLWSKLPYHSLQNHALVSGNHLYHLVPHPELVYAPAETREDRTQSPDGTVFLSQLQHLAVKYGPLSEYLPAAAVGRVLDADLPLLREAGLACWHAAYRGKQVIEVRVRRKGDQAATFALPPAPRTGQPAVQPLIDEIHAETARIWIDPPTELVRVHQGLIASRAGSYGQYLSTLVFVNGETRPLGYSALNGLVRACATTEVSLDTLRALTANFARTPAEFLGYCGLETLWRFTRRTLDALDLLRTREEYFALVSTLALYINCLNTWNLHLFPWHHGEEYRYQPSASATGPRSSFSVPTLSPDPR